MTSALIIFYVFIALLLIALVLLQDPKGGGGALFGGGGGKSLFGATGATSFIVKATRAIAILFALCVIGLNYTLMKGNNSSAVDGNTEISAPVLGGGAVKTDEVEKAKADVQTDSQTQKEEPKGEEQ